MWLVFCFFIREPPPLWLAQTVEILMTTTCPWIPARHRSALPRLTALRITTFLWAPGHITLTSQGSLQRYLLVRAAAPPCVTGPVASAMSHHHPSTATSNLTGNVSLFKFNTNSRYFLLSLLCILCFCLYKDPVFCLLLFSLQQSQRRSTWRTAGSSMSCHIRVPSPCLGRDPCES